MRKLNIMLTDAMDAMKSGHFMGVFIMMTGLVFVAPVMQKLTEANWVVDVALGLVLLFIIASVVKQRLLAAVAILLAVIGFFSRIFPDAESHQGLFTTSSTALVVFFLILSVLIFGYVLRTRNVGANTIWAALCVYMFIGVLWSFMYAIIIHANIGAFSFPSSFLSGDSGDVGVPGFSVCVYYSFVTLTTLGYGDMTPISVTARSLSSLEAITGQIYLTVLVARLVGIHIVQNEKGGKA
jgi:hypothetical protein